MTTNDPRTWKVPVWHPDFGDPKVEVDMLRKFCLGLIEAIPDLRAEIVFPEEGYLNVDISREDGRKIAEVHVVADDDRQKFALFGFDESVETGLEHYFSDLSDGIELVSSMITG